MATAAVTGLAAEARIARRHGIEAVATGGDAARTARLAEELMQDGASLVSFGIAGALAPGLAPGDVLLPRQVRDAAGTIYAVDPAWRACVDDRLRSRGIAPAEGDLLGAPRLVATSAEKAALHRASAALAVDLESHIVAAAARRMGRPFLVLRVVADPARLDLPRAAAVGLGGDGRVAPGAVLRALLRDPGQLGDLVRLARHTRRALVMLNRVAAAIGAA